MAINWEDRANWGGHVHHASDGSWLDNESKEDE
jgi:hypothetical protein